MLDPIGIGLLGCGIVGGATARILLEHPKDLGARAGAPIELMRVAVRDLSKDRSVEVPTGLMTSDAWEVVRDPSVRVVVETIGGVEPARALILEAIRLGKHVVTANKELLATAGRDVMEAADAAGIDLLFEASVAGGIPIIRPMRESLAGDRVRRVMGIVNGTTNFILTRMSETKESFPEALADAERRGYTELDPTADIEGFDAAAKLSILASIAFNADVVADDVQQQGITEVTPADVTAAHELGYEVKLLAVAEKEDGQISARVHPAMLPRTHPLAAVRDEFNAVFVEGENVGELMFFGRGAGGRPTASAVVGDIVEIARNMATGSRAPISTSYRTRARMRPVGEAHTRYYVVLSVADQPGVLSAVAGVFARYEVSIASVRQEGSGEEATLVLITHSATEHQHEATFAGLETLQAVKSIQSKMRVVGTPEG